MARTKSMASIDTEIVKVQEQLERLQARYDKTTEKLEQLQEQKKKLQADQIMEAYLASGKSFDELMTFLKP